MTKMDDAFVAVDAEYDREHGFLGRLRIGVFDRVGADRLLEVLRDIDASSDALIDRRLVAVLWYLPLSIDWQLERVPEAHRHELRDVRDAVITELERILGAP